MQPKYESNQAASMPQTNPNQESALQQLNEELAKAEESFETMRRSMPLVPGKRVATAQRGACQS